MKIKTEIISVPGAPLEGVNPFPRFRDKKASKYSFGENFPEGLKKDLGTRVKVLPYLMQDRYQRKRVPIKIKTIILENDYLKAVFMPEYGGRMYSLFDKINNIDLIMKNPVIQPANLAIRNAWLSGGIEWNIGSIGHTFTTCDNVFSAILDDGEGNDFLRIYEFERCTNVFWQVDFHLPENASQLFCHVSLLNPFDEDTTTYWWTNIAVPDTGKTRILSSSEKVILFMGGKLEYEKLPYVKAMPGAEISYPSQATRGFDYFFQPEDIKKGAWEAAAYEHGNVFYERSTSPLVFRKMFCWGNHHGGKHWQEFLSDKGSGYYAEIQAGIAPSQMHDKVFKKNHKMEWTQCFGGIKLDKKSLFQQSLHSANLYLDEKIDDEICYLDLVEYDKKFSIIAKKKTEEKNIVHNGSGWGALEIMRMSFYGDSDVPESMCFPKSTLQGEQYPWISLLENGIMPDEDVNEVPKSWMTSKKWLKIMENGLEKGGGRTWHSLLFYGCALYEQDDTERVASEAQNWSKRAEFEEKAKKAWLESVKLKPSVWAYRNLAATESNNEKAIFYYEKAFELPAAYSDFSLSAEYISILCKLEKYKRAWSAYEDMPKSIKNVDRVMICIAPAAVELKKTEFLEAFFNREHFDIREGEATLTDLWFKYCSILLSEENGIDEPTVDQSAEFLEIAKEKCPPPENIDFRMSTDKNEKYRVEE